MHNHSHVIEFSIGVSFVLGVLHALEPGHGKSAMFVYMLQQRKSFWHPIVMGVTTGLSHAASLMVIALAVHLGVHILSGDEHAGHQHAGEALQWISSVLLVGIGFRLLYLARRGKLSKKTCSCCRDAKVASETTGCSTPARPAGTSMRMTVLLGIAVGLLPCPTALPSYWRLFGRHRLVVNPMRIPLSVCG
jgi:nickel/cobalt transporter (NicO) family protein